MTEGVMAAVMWRPCGVSCGWYRRIPGCIVAFDAEGADDCCYYGFEVGKCCSCGCCDALRNQKKNCNAEMNDNDNITFTAAPLVL
jgi:hypothetical protein